MICEQCREREATSHCTTVSDGVAVTRSLCDECFASSAEPEVRDFYLAGKTARCRYCGELAVCGGMDAPESTGEARSMNFLCARCAAEFWRYWQEQLGRVSQELPQQEQMAKMRLLLEDGERHMSKWVKQRDADG